MGKRRDFTDYWLCAALVAITLAVYWQVRAFGFVIVDDQGYVQKNPHVLGGLSAESIRWAFTTFSQANWHPLTWLSLMADAQIGGSDAGLFHLTNVLFHVFNALLLFAFLRSVTGYWWRSAAVAALFAIHPLHVESVAWITERKDVLSTFFWLLTMLAYVHYVRQRRPWRYLLVLTSFALGLLAKPMLVSLPVVLLLMDLWPLRRTDTWWRLVREKIPLFGLACASCAVTVHAQSHGGAVVSTVMLPFGVRAANAVVACVGYIGKMLSPLNLSMAYPHPGHTLPAWQVVGSGLLLAIVTVVALRSARRLPYLTVGWLWYLVTLVPVIGLVQVGYRAMADRYTYVPLIGLFIVLTWGVPDMLACMQRGRERQSFVFPVLGCVILIALMACTYFQVGYWRNGVTLCEHALAIDKGNWIAHICRGDAYALAGDSAGAVAEYGRGLQLNPAAAVSARRLGAVLVRMGTLKEGARFYTTALRELPAVEGFHSNLGLLLLKSRRPADAIWHLRRALEVNPTDVSVINNLGCAYRGVGEFSRARQQFEAALRLSPRNVRVKANLASLCER